MDNMIRTVAVTRLALFLAYLSSFGVPIVSAGQFPSHNLGEVSDVFFLNPLRGWVSASDQQAIFLTSDGGETWTRHLTPTGLYHITFIDPDAGWALGGTLDHDSRPSLGVFRTENAGRTWNLVSYINDVVPGEGGYINDIIFLNHQTGYLIGAQKGGNSIVLVTHNGGRTFSRIEELSGVFGGSRGIFSDKSGGVWITGNEHMIVSRDNGEHWQIRRPDNWNGGSVIEGGQFTDDVHGFAIGMRIFSTSDGGGHWTEVADSRQGQPFTAINFWDKEHGCVASDTRLLFCSTDGGQSWATRRVLPVSKNPQQPDGNRFFRMFFVHGGQVGWLLDYEGNLFKSTDTGGTWQPFHFPTNN